MKIIIQSILFIIIVGLFAVTSDRLSKVQNIESMSSSGNNGVKMDDQEFLNNAIPHHEGAIVMSQVALANSKRPEILEFASIVVATETKNIDQLYTWRRDWYGLTDRIFLDKVGRDVSMIKDLGSYDQEFDLRFLNAMIEHHEGALEMLNNILVPTTKPEIHSMATTAIIGLSKDVEIMKEWRNKWYGK